MSYKVEAINETWGQAQVVQCSREIPTYADMKALICDTVRVMIADIVKMNADYRYKTMTEVPGKVYSVLVEWCPDGPLVDPDGTNMHEPSHGLQCAVILSGKFDDTK